MKLLFKQRMFSWFDSYDIYDENENTVYVVKGQLSWGHCLKIFDTEENELGTVKQEVLTWLPKFELYEGDNYIGCLERNWDGSSPGTTSISTAGMWRGISPGGITPLQSRWERQSQRFPKSCCNGRTPMCWISLTRQTRSMC